MPGYQASEQTRRCVARLVIRASLPRWAGDGAAVRKEEDLDGDGEACVQGDDDDEKDLADLAVGGAEDRVQVPDEEDDREAEADSDEDPVEDGQRRPANDGDGNPDEVGVAVKGPAFEQVGELAAKVAEGKEESDGDEEGVAIDETSGAAQQREVVGERGLVRVRQVLANSAAEEEDEDDRRRDPERPVQVGVPLEHVEEIGTREERRPTARQNGRCVNVEELGVEGYRPKETLGGARRSRGRRREAGGGRLAGARGGVVKVGVVEGEILLEVCVAEIALWSCILSVRKAMRCSVVEDLDYQG
jgi:hypothetical protein